MFAMLFATLLAQEPHITGSVALDPANGALRGDICTSGFAQRWPLRFLLNAALNIKAVTDSAHRVLEYSGYYDGRLVGEAREYVVGMTDSAATPTHFCVEYAGAVPVYESNTAIVDWKGQIVATAGTLRAAEQAKWYPVLYDSATTQQATTVSYNLDVHCARCRTVFLNGSPAVQDTVGRFVSSVPRDILLYAGDVPVYSNPVLSVIGGSASAGTVQTFADALRSIGDYYTKLLGVPYGEKPVFLTFNSVSRNHQPGTVNWQFVTWPTIAFSGGISFDALLDESSGKPRMQTWLWPSLSHEMAHYYFGTVKMPRGPLGWFELESTAEYLSWQSTRAMRGEAAYVRRLLDVVGGDLASMKFPVLADISDANEITSEYRYRLAPLYLLKLEQTVGKAKVARMLTQRLTAQKAHPAEYVSFERSATAAGISTTDFRRATSSSPAELRDLVVKLAHEALKSLDRTDVLSVLTGLIDVDSTEAGRRDIFAHLRAFTSIQPGNAMAWYQAGRLASASGKELEFGQQALERYLTLPPERNAPSPAEANALLGAIAERRGDLKRARGYYEAALRIDPKHKGAQERLAHLTDDR